MHISAFFRAIHQLLPALLSNVCVQYRSCPPLLLSLAFVADQSKDAFHEAGKPSRKRTVITFRSRVKREKIKYHQLEIVYSQDCVSERLAMYDNDNAL